MRTGQETKKSRPQSAGCIHGKLRAAVFFFLNAGEFESCVFPGVPKSSEFASPMRYFAAPYFFQCSLIIQNSISFSRFIAEIPHRSVGFLPASFLPMQVGGDGEIRILLREINGVYKADKYVADQAAKRRNEKKKP